MPRRGLCRCGTVLKFESGPDGYKMRCPGCGAVVRLRADAADSAEGTRRRQRSGVLAFLPPAPSDPEVPRGQAPVTPENYDYDALRPGELPVVEMVPLSELLPPPLPSWWRRWWLPLSAAVVLAAAVVVVIVVLRT
jgi:hypothetical protein